MNWRFVLRFTKSETGRSIYVKVCVYGVASREALISKHVLRLLPSLLESVFFRIEGSEFLGVTWTWLSSVAVKTFADLDYQMTAIICHLLPRPSGFSDDSDLHF